VARARTGDKRAWDALAERYAPLIWSICRRYRLSGVGAACAVSMLAVVLAGVRRRREEHLAQMTAIAQASQLALMPPLPPQISGINIAARYRSATPGAWAGGDLYEIIPTGHGIRVIIGDVRGRGLDAVLLARHVLSAFRRSAVAAPALDHVAGEVSRAIKPHLGEEDFVTAALAQLAPGGELTVVNCGHHPPLLHHGGALRPLAGQTAALPLGLEDDFTASPRAGGPVTGSCSTPTGLSKAATSTGTSSRKTRSPRRFSPPTATRRWMR
jgi:serine phosphatase RsbU (regulator of sigma subunit)